MARDDKWLALVAMARHQTVATLVRLTSFGGTRYFMRVKSQKLTKSVSKEMDP